MFHNSLIYNCTCSNLFYKYVIHSLLRVVAHVIRFGRMDFFYNELNDTDCGSITQLQILITYPLITRTTLAHLPLLTDPLFAHTPLAHTPLAHLPLIFDHPPFTCTILSLTTLQIYEK